MKQVILVEDRQKVQELLENNLLNSFENVEVVPKKNSAEALAAMELLPETPLVICRDFMDEDETAKNIIYFIKQNRYPARIMVIGKIPDIPGRNRAVSIPDPPRYKDIVRHVSKILKIPIVPDKQDELSGYSPLSINYFVELETCCCDVYLRIRKRNEPDQYVKVIRAEETFSHKQIAKYAGQNVEFLYVDKEKKQNFINFLSDRWVAKIDRLNDSDTKFAKKVELLTIAHEIIAREVNEEGFNPAMLQLCDSFVSSIMARSVEEHSPIPNILQQIAGAQSHYMYKHGHILLALSLQVLRTMGMNDKNTHTTLCYASLFKDTSLIRNPPLSQITNFEELESADIGQHEYNAVINHACESAFILKGHHGIPPKSLELIMRHHGHLTGNGFSNAHFGKFDILDKIFFINCEFVKEFLTFDKAAGQPHQRTIPITYRLRRRYFFPELSDAIDILNKTLPKQKV